MNDPWILAGGAMIAMALAGCDGASSARETASRDLPPAANIAPPGSDLAKDVEDVAQPAADAAEEAPQPDGAGYIEATFDDIKFPMEKTEKFERSMLTPEVRSLLGKPIRIRGYMYPTLRKRGLTQFVLVRDNMECCFGPGAALFDCILVSMAPGKTAEYSIRPIAVEGMFRLEEVPGGKDGRPLAIYQMVGDGVQ
jgi:hypothetical protein